MSWFAACFTCLFHLSTRRAVATAPFPASVRRSWLVPPCFRSLTVGNKLYVGNLTYRTNSSDLKQLFSQFGSVQSAEVISDRDTGRSKGFGFVEMSTDAEAKAAIDGLHDTEVDGRRLTVNEARPREPRTGGGGGGWRGGSGSGGSAEGRGNRGGGGYGDRRY